MERRLNEAAVEGNTTCLLELLQEDALILDRIIVNHVNETPLHIAAMLGHLDFAREILSRKPELARELNSQGQSPLHLASAIGHVEMVKELLKADSQVCLLRDPHGITALHAAGIKGRVGVIKELILAMPELTRILTDRGETVVHVCVAHNQIEAAKLLVEIMELDEEMLKWKDHNGNTVLHLAVAKRQIQMVKLLVGNSSVDVNALNMIGLTALDVLIQSSTQLYDIEIGEILRGAGAMTSAHMSQSIGHQIPIANNHQMGLLPPAPAPPPAQPQAQKTKKRKGVGKDANTLMVVAILIAIMTFEAGFNIPKWYCTNNGVKCHISDYDGLIDIIIFIDIIGFLSSMSIIVLIISGFPLQRRYLMWVLNVTMMIAVSSVVMFFTYWWKHKGTGSFIENLPIIWLGLIVLLCLWQLIRFFIWLLKRCGIIAKKERGKGLLIDSNGEV